MCSWQHVAPGGLTNISCFNVCVMGQNTICFTYFKHFPVYITFTKFHRFSKANVVIRKNCATTGEWFCRLLPSNVWCPETHGSTMTIRSVLCFQCWMSEPKRQSRCILWFVHLFIGYTDVGVVQFLDLIDKSKVHNALIIVRTSSPVLVIESWRYIGLLIVQRWCLYSKSNIKSNQVK